MPIPAKHFLWLSIKHHSRWLDCVFGCWTARFLDDMFVITCRMGTTLFLQKYDVFSIREAHCIAFKSPQILEFYSNKIKN